jgi:hypothetical protein
LIRPQKTVTETICRVDISNQWVRLLLPEKRDDFRDLVKKFRYQWEGSWCRQFSQSVDICDRAAEICNELLIAGFCIQVANDKVKDRIIAQSFTPEQFKLISKCVSGAYSGQFSFAYPKSESDRWYKEINKLNGCRYADGVLYVPSEQFEEVEDFAECNDFGFSEGALSLISKAKALKESAIIFTPTRKQRKKKNELTRTDSIPAHLRDDGDD